MNLCRKPRKERIKKEWADWEATPEADAFMEKWVEITETGGTNEIWTLVE